MEEYSDIFVWQGVGGGKKFDSYDFATTISDFEDRVALTSDLQPEVRDSFTDSLSAIRNTLSRLGQGRSERHKWEIRLEATLKAIEKNIEKEGLNEKSAEALESEVEELKFEVKELK